MPRKLFLIIVTANLQAHMALSKVRRSVKKIRRYAHPALLGFQEIGGSRKWLVIRAALGVKRYRGARIAGAASATPVAWLRSRFRLEKRTHWDLSKRTNVGKVGPGPKWLRAKAATVVVLWDKLEHHHIVFVNCHLAPTPDLNNARSELSAEQITRLVELVNWIRGTYPKAYFFIVGDFNITHRTRLQPLVDVGLRIGRDKDDHGNHALSRVLSSVPHSGMSLIQDDSDHDALVARF